MAKPLKHPVGKADAFDLPLDSKLADYFVNSVGQLAWMLIEFAIAGSKCKRPAWMKSIALERLFLPTFLSCSKKVGWTKGFV